jgi:type II secretory pathway pseudopilin PulG
MREKLPELMVEAAMVVLAVVIALGVDEWREGQQQRELASRALQVVMAELEANRAELADNLPPNQALLESVIEADRAGELGEDFDLTFEYSLISSSAWETAQVTQATHFMPLEHVQRLATLYGLQELFGRAQDRVLNFILDVGPIARDDPNQIPSLVRGSLTNAVGMTGVLLEAYEGTLQEIGGTEPGR